MTVFGHLIIFLTIELNLVQAHMGAVYLGSETAGIIGDLLVFTSINLNLITGTYGREYPFYECLRQTLNYSAALE